MLMDLFYDTLPPNITRKRRVHFHAFMIDVHKRVHKLRSERDELADPILPVARDLAEQANVLCLDEFQVAITTPGNTLPTAECDDRLQISELQ